MIRTICIVMIASVTTRRTTLTQLRFAIQNSGLRAEAQFTLRPKALVSNKAAIGNPITPNKRKRQTNTPQTPRPTTLLTMLLGSIR